MNDNISTLTIVFMAVSAGLSILAPITAIVIMGMRKRMNWKAMILGAVLFIVFVIILESLLHLVVIGDPTKSVIYGNLVLYVLYGGFAAGIFEETARLLCFKFILKVKKDESMDTGISYGLGHGGIEAVLIGGLGTVSSLMMSVMYNSGALDSVTAALNSEQLNAFNKDIDMIRNMSPDFFLMGGFERMVALLLQVALSLFVFKAVSDKKWMYFIYAILIHAGIDMFAILYQRGFITNIYVLEGIVLAGTAITAFFAFRLFSRNEARKPA